LVKNLQRRSSALRGRQPKVHSASKPLRRILPLPPEDRIAVFDQDATLRGPFDQ
jgi:hypothetical protein